MGISYNSTDLDSVGFVLIADGQPLERGLLGLPANTYQDTVIPGRPFVERTLLRREARTVRLECALVAADHTTLITNRDTFMNLVGGSDFVPLVVPDRTDRRLMVVTEGELDLQRLGIPWGETGLRFTWMLRCKHPYLEDGTAQTASPVVSPLVNDGDQACPVTWTCTVTNTLASGLWFEVAGKRFTYTGALATNDVLTVESGELPTPKKNGTVDWAHVSSAAEFPWLAKGSNVVTKSSANFTLAASYRRWWR